MKAQAARLMANLAYQPPHKGPIVEAGGMQALANAAQEALPHGYVNTADADAAAALLLEAAAAIGNLGPHGVERPLYDGATKKFTKFDAGWAERKFPIDMNAFSFDFELLRGQRRPLFGAGRGAYGHEGFGGETEMVERLISKPEELQPLGNLCSEVSVLHNGWKDPARVREAERREADAAVERPLDLERAVRQACEREATSARIR